MECHLPLLGLYSGSLTYCALSSHHGWLQLVLFLAWHVVAIDTGRLPGARKLMGNVPDLGSSSTLPIPGFECSNSGNEKDHIWLCSSEKLYRVPFNLTSASISERMTLSLFFKSIKHQQLCMLVRYRWGILSWYYSSSSRRLEGAGIRVLREDSLTPYAGILYELCLVNLPEFHTLEPRIFHNTVELQTIYVNKASKLTHIHREVFNVNLTRLKNIRIMRTALLALPYHGNLITGNTLRTIHFENNRTRSLPTASIKISSEDLFPSPKVDLTVPKFLMCNLAIADLCMGIYLILITGMDAHSIGEYFNHAIDWQSGPGCEVAGFLTVFSTELSIFTLTAITSERWYTITYAIHLDRQLKLKTSLIIMVIGWVYACVMATLPLIDVSGYAKTSSCLPLANRNKKDLLYLVTLLIFNGLAFSAIVACYGCMYSSVRGSCETATTTARTNIILTKRMALLVFTDFVCWASIAFFAITALAGQPLISIMQTKILLVFIYPLNSCANPYLYALLTHQYRYDVFMLLDCHGMCKDRAAKYKGTGTATMHSVKSADDRLRNHGTTLANWTLDSRQRGSIPITTITSSDVSTHNNRCMLDNRFTRVPHMIRV